MKMQDAFRKGGTLFTTLCLATTLTMSLKAQDIQVHNLTSGTTLSYPVVLLAGEVALEAGSRASLVKAEEMTWVERSKCDHQHSIRVTNLSSNLPSRTYQSTMFRGEYKALAELVPGANRLRLESGNRSTEITINYRPIVTTNRVRLIYITDKSGNTRYDTQFATDAQDYRPRIETAAKLMQTFLAEKMYALGYGRKTFGLEQDAQGKPIVHTIRLPYSASYLNSCNKNEIWTLCNAAVERQLGGKGFKNLVITAFSHYDTNTKRAMGQVALGGMNTGVISNLGMCSWPRHIGDVARAFSDTTPVCDTKIYNDSSYRNTLWGVAATTMGAGMHELGHTFGLDHSTDPHCIMSRGFDAFHRAFMVDDAPSDRNWVTIHFTEEESVTLQSDAAKLLAGSQWLQTREVSRYARRSGTTLSW